MQKFNSKNNKKHRTVFCQFKKIGQTSCIGRMEKAKKRASGFCTSLKCSGCKKRIRSRFFVTALEETWHERCLTCDICHEILFSFGSGKYYCRSGMKLCKMDYIRLYGKHGICSMCNDVIQPTERVMKFKNYTYHQHCFHCSICQKHFEKGECAVIPTDKVILCQTHHADYELALSASASAASAAENNPPVDALLNEFNDFIDFTDFNDFNDFIGFNESILPMDFTLG